MQNIRTCIVAATILMIAGVASRPLAGDAGSQGASQTEKPSFQQLVDATKRRVNGAIMNTAVFNALRVNNGCSLCDTVEVLDAALVRWGLFSEAERYWPAELCVTVSASDSVSEGLRRQFGGAASARKVFAGKVRARFSRDDFGDWRAEIIPPVGSERLSDITCSPSSTVSVAEPGISPEASPAAKASPFIIEYTELGDGIRRNGEVTGTGNRFPSSTRTIVSKVQVARERAGQRVEHVWIRPDGQEFIRTTSVLDSPSRDPDLVQFVTSTLKRGREPLQLGDWRIDLYVDGALQKRVPFAVY